MLANSLATGGGAIRSASGADATLAHAGLGHDASHKVDWRPELSVADARATEGADAAVEFQVSLSRAFTTAEHSVTVDYATADGTARAGEDYTATSGTLTFGPGETEKAVSVPILDDVLDEGEETFTLRLSNAKGARIGDGEATGTISNDDPLQKMWLSRFGRTVADHVTGAVSVWGLAGVGTGDMAIVQKANARGQPERTTRTDLSMRLAALGGRGALMEAGENGGFDLALKADGFFVETTSEAISNEGDTTGEASRVRLALEGGRAFPMDGGGVLTPGLELGLRHDGGDAETGAGVELGGRVAYTDSETGLSVEALGRALVAHEDSDYREWGASGAVRLAPGEGGRGLSFSLAPTYGAPGSGMDRLWSAKDARGLGPGGGEFEPESRLAGELGYGIGLFGDRFTGTPNLGIGMSGAGARDYRIGWRLNPAGGGSSFELRLDATRREAANDDTEPGHGLQLRFNTRW